MSNEITVSLSQTNPVTSVTVHGDTANSIEIPEVAEIDVSAATAVQASLPSLAVAAGSNITVDSSTGVFVISATVPEDIEDLSNVSGTPTVGQVLVWSGTSWQPENQDTGGTSNVDELTDLSDVSGIPSTGQILVYSGNEWNPANPADVATSINDLTDVSGTPTVGQVLAWSGTDYQPVDAASTDDPLTTTSGDLVLDPATGGVVVQGGTDGSGSLTLNCEVNSHGVELKAPAHSAFSGNLSFTLPNSTGLAGQVLATDGNGLMSWSDSSSQIEWVVPPTTSSDLGSAGQIAYDGAGFFYVHDGTLWRRTQLQSFGIGAPEITINAITPEDSDVINGDATSFFVSATVTQGLSLSYQWQLSSDSGVTFVDISGQNQNTLTLTPAISDNGNSYRCRVSADGAVDKISRAALLTVSNTAQLLTESNDDLQAENGDYIFHDGATAGTGTDPGGDTNEEKSLTITQHPQDINGYTFESWPKDISFSVAAASSGGNLTYQWQKGYSTGDNDEWSDISGEVSSTLVYSMSLSESYEGRDFRCVISVGGIRGAVSNPATFRRVADYIIGAPRIRSTSFGDEFFTIDGNYPQQSTFTSITRGNYEVQATKIDANTGERDYDWDSTSPDRVMTSTYSDGTVVYEELFGDPDGQLLLQTDLVAADRGSTSLRFRTYDTVDGIRTEYGEWTYHGWGAIKNPEDAVFFAGQATFEGDFASKFYYSTAIEGVDRHEVTALQWQKKASGSSTWNDIPSANSKRLTITTGNNGDQFRLKGGAPGKPTVYTQSATLGVASSGGGGGGGGSSVNAPASFEASLPGGSPYTLPMTLQSSSTDCQVQILVDLSLTISTDSFLVSFSGTGGHDDTNVYHTASLQASGYVNSYQSYGASSGNTAGHWSFEFTPQSTKNTGNGNFNLSNDVISYGSFSGGVASVRIFDARSNPTGSFIFPDPTTIQSSVLNYTVQYKRVNEDGSDGNFSYWTTLQTTSNTLSTHSLSINSLIGGHSYKFRARANSATQHSDWTEDSTVHTLSYLKGQNTLTGLSNAYCDDG